MLLRLHCRDALHLLAAVMACSSPGASVAGEAQADVAPWSAPRRLTADGGGALALWAPSLAVWKDRLVLAGNVVNAQDRVGPGSLGGHRLAIDGRPRAVDSLFGLYPRVAVSPRTGTRHLVWGEPAGRDSVTWLARPQSLWWASIDSTGAWSGPARILSDMEVQWAPTLSSAPAFDVEGTLHVAVAVWSATTGNHVAHLALERSGWRMTPVHRGMATHTALGVADNGDLAVSWVSPVRDGPPNAAHVSFSADRGRSWTAAMRLDTARYEESGQLRIVGLRDSFIALWGRYGAATFPLASIHRAVVRAASRTVVPLPPIDPSYPIYGPETARDACGRAHLVVRHIAEPSIHADHAALTHGPDTLQHVDPATPVSEIDIAVAGGSLALAWVGRTAAGRFESQVRTRPMLCGR